ncbi:MAG: succinate dehydrogenase, cytochrome b556 subunit [Casimicrobiaceae bacterium]
MSGAPSLADRKRDGAPLRAHAHPAWWAFVVHRSSGVALAAFLPLHFWALSSAVGGAPALDGFLRFTDQPGVRVAEWGLVVLLSLHLTGGLRLLLIEFGPWRGLRKDWIAGGVGAGALVGLAYGLALLR